MDGGNGNPEGTGLFPIHVDPVFRHIFKAIGPDFGQASIFESHAEKLVAGCHELFMTESPPVQQLEVKPGRYPQLDDGGRGEGEDQAIAELRKSLCGPLCNGPYIQILSISSKYPVLKDDEQIWVAETPVLELDKCHAIGLRPSGKAKAGNGHARFHRLFFVLLKMALYLLHDFLRLLQGGACRQYNLGEKNSLVLIGDVGR